MNFRLPKILSVPNAGRFFWAPGIGYSLVIRQRSLVIPPHDLPSHRGAGIAGGGAAARRLFYPAGRGSGRAGDWRVADADPGFSLAAAIGYEPVRGAVDHHVSLFIA